MTSNRDRQRAAARTRLEREMTERAEQVRRQRKTRSTILIAVAVVVVIGAVTWISLAVGGSKKKSTASPAASASAGASASPTTCSYLPLTDPTASPKQVLPTTIKNVGTPPAGEKRTGTQTMTITTNLGVITVQVQTAKAPCAANSFTYLASKKFFDNTKCHRLVTSNIYVLQCGDPSATGTGGPNYRYLEENLPTDQRPTYPAGTVAIANSGSAASSGSQFFIVYQDTTAISANYTVLGTVTSGLDIVKKVAAGGVIPDPKAQEPGDGAPKTPITIKTLTVS